MPRSDRLAGLILLLLLLTSAPAVGAEPSAFFEQKIRPVLVEKCYACHSAAANKSKGGLFLDTKAGLLKGGESGPALVPGKPAESLLIKAVRYDHDLKMPPKGKLSAEAIADLEKWLAMGAPDPREATGPVVHKTIDMENARQFWAYQKPKRVAAPAVKDTSWARTDIDRFILAGLEAKGLRPAPDADRATLLRRVYFDLIGLPPTLAQSDAFVNDTSPEAFVKVVDELLASKQFGERWGRHWLDVARYSESSGGGRSLMYKDAWRYRDYVIDAFNSDRPYDRFIMEQIAGDLLPYFSAEQRKQQLIATAFLVLGPTNYEEQHKETLEMDVIDEQLDTLGRVFLGMTIGCARCHDHKFDPIPTKDYYALAGIFKSTQTLIHDNVSRWVDAPLPVAGEQQAALEKHDAAVAALKQRIDEAKAGEKRTGTVPNSGVIAANRLPGVVIDDAQAKQVGEWVKSTALKTYIGAGYLHDGNTGKGKKTLTFTPKLPAAGRYEVRLAYPAASNRATKVPVFVLHQDGEFTGVVNEQVTPHIDGRFVSVGTFRFDTTDKWYVIVSNEGTTGHVVVDAVQFIPEEMAKGQKDKKDPPKEIPPQGDSRALEAELKKLLARGPERPVAMVVKEASKVEDCHVCVRGNIRNVGDKVARGFLQAATAGPMPSLPAKESGRRELAAWLASAANPLTARVMANRLWHHLHGTGIVPSVDVFGTTGDQPSNPALLDHIALRLIDQGWSMKKMIREIVLSRSYQIADCGLRIADLKTEGNRSSNPQSAIRNWLIRKIASTAGTRGGGWKRKSFATRSCSSAASSSAASADQTGRPARRPRSATSSTTRGAASTHPFSATGCSNFSRRSTSPIRTWLSADAMSAPWRRRRSS